MSAVFMHIGIPVDRKKPNMIYNDDFKLWMTDPEDYDFKIEYLKYEEGTPFPEIIQHMPHVAYRVDQIETYIKEVSQVVFGPINAGASVRVAFALLDGAMIELYEDNG